MNIYRDFLLSDIVYYKIGGKAKYVLSIETRKDLLDAFDFLSSNKIDRVLPIGLGANLLLNDTPFDGAILWFKNQNKKLIRQTATGFTEAFASETLNNLIQYTFRHQRIGLEWAGGLPSSIGGAILGNVGAFGGEIKNIVEKVEVFKWTGNE